MTSLKDVKLDWSHSRAVLEKREGENFEHVSSLQKTLG